MPVKRTARSCSDAIDFLGLFIEDGPDEVPAGGNDSTDEDDGPGCDKSTGDRAVFA